MKKLRRLVIADDLTGANDAGVHFLSDSEEVEVIIDAGNFIDQNINHSVDTLVINTGTRNVSPEDASIRIKHYLDRYLQYNPTEIYKKIDSTFRGNVGTEIDAVMLKSNFKLACVAPAVPRNGRTTVDGICYVHGVPLTETEFAIDPFSPVESSNAMEIIKSQTTRKVGVLSLQTLRKNAHEAIGSLRSLVEDGYEIIIVDSETKEDLLQAYKLFNHLEEKVLYVGAAGFFHAISTPQTIIPEVTFKNGLKTLFITGSMMEISRKQSEWLVEKGYVNKSFVVVSKNAIENEEAEVSRIAQGVSTVFEHEQIALIHTDRDSTEVSHSAIKVGHTISKIVLEVLKNTQIDVLVVTGGETALTILSLLDIHSLHLIYEPLPAVPVSLLSVPANGDLLFVSKAGSYGEIDVFEGILGYLNKQYESNKIQEMN